MTSPELTQLTDGNAITEGDQKRKLDLVVTTAEPIWGDAWTGDGG